MKVWSLVTCKMARFIFSFGCLWLGNFVNDESDDDVDRMEPWSNQYGSCVCVSVKGSKVRGHWTGEQMHWFSGRQWCYPRWPQSGDKICVFVFVSKIFSSCLPWNLGLKKQNKNTFASLTLGARRTTSSESTSSLLRSSGAEVTNTTTQQQHQWIVRRLRLAARLCSSFLTRAA